MTPHDFALLAQAAYDDAPDIGVSKEASCAIVRDVDAGRVIAFPGTDSVADLLTDFNIDSASAPMIGPLHDGFWTAYARIKPAILAAAAGHKIIFVGHSLGAALAEVAAADFVANGNAVEAVYAFAPPRISPRSMVAHILRDTQVNQYRKGNDIVPTVPPLWFHGSMSMVQIGTPAWPFPNLKDHELAGYIAALDNGQATSG
jgi:triacylglycerol lipase